MKKNRLITAALALALAGPVLAAPPADSEPRFDLAVSNAPATQVFSQLAVGTGYSVLVSPEVGGQVSLTLRDTTVLEALESLRELYGYDFRIAGKRIFVQPNTIQTRLFKINYLPGRRQGASDLRVTSSAITTASTGGQNGQGGNSTQPPSQSQGGQQGQRQDEAAHVRMTSDADFWREVQSSLNALVGNADKRSVVLNPAAGVIVVRALPGELRQVEQYLKAIQLSIERQVMLEAKIIEVELNEDAQAGVNWNAFASSLLDGRLRATIGVGAPGVTLNSNGSFTDGAGNQVTAGGTVSTAPLGKGFYGLALQTRNFSSLLNFLESQGKAHVLSSPRIATLNNQKAVLKVGTDELFVTGISTTTTTSGANNNAVASPTLTLTPFFSGIALDVTPQIDDEGNVILHVHPAISTVTERTKNLDLGTLGTYRFPLASSSVNETDSIVRVKDGQIVAIGGLMQQVTSTDRSGMPGISKIPLIGGLFRQSADVNKKRELVILMKPTVIAADGSTWPEAQIPASTPRTE
ncbi:pilus (MSHA type) biogenesis protein MshL [Pelomonas sp. SE-A7]|uniref:pilus (MSHA type) biogenesis protein MshL n=1 Tax=Pelomonas sp. SE-A7 TaxID=3054953 RepID=UPI00259C7896|nr:pilus (MSHA type) biogenesis protein MshL [Pelomonas sp. SE-A7]MDM4767783.1 pilus (MSHA type) biogenesis protein MshL [Pelomonas sp. SE-A7]